MAGVSFNVQAEVIGAKELSKKLNKLADDSEVKQDIFQELLKGGLLIQATAVRSIVSVTPGSTPGVRYNPKRDVKISPPFGPPNADTGFLHKSIRVGFSEKNSEVEVGTNVLYGAWLEFGTQTMPPRPWLAPAFAANSAKILAMIKKIAKEAVKKAAT